MNKKNILLSALALLTVLLACNLPSSTSPISTEIDASTLPTIGPTPELIPTLTQVPVRVDPLQFGIESGNINDPTRINLIGGIGAKTIRRNALFWSDVEPVEGARNWETLADLDVELEAAARGGYEVILIVRKTPEWARLVPESECGPIKQEKFHAFAGFLKDAVQRYSQPPFKVKYWELGNEPDAPVTEQPIPYGCWGNWEDDYYGGGYYAGMLKVAYPAIKAADPQAQVLIGGLLLDCDPQNPPDDKDCKPARFFEGILFYGGGDFFDIVSFHGYPQYNGSLQLDENFPGWDRRGGVVLGKIDYLRQVMAAYGVDKPLMHTEGSLLCSERNVEQCNPPGEDFYEAQADYVVWLFVRNLAEGIQTTIWYTFEGPGWRYGGLLDTNQGPKPAYYAYQFLTNMLKDTFYTGQVWEYPDLRGYEFISQEKRIWVLWSADKQSFPITLPSETRKVYDKYGKDITPGDLKIIVKSPIYVELTSH